MKHPSTAPGTAAAATAPARRPRGRPRKDEAAPDDGNRRRALIDGAARLFRAQGYAATTTRDIAAAAGMHSGSPFYHFSSKSALLHAVMHEGMRSAAASQQALLQALPQGLPARAVLGRLIRHHLQVLLGPGSDFIPVMLYEWRSLTPAQRKDIGAIKDAYEAQWVPVLQALQAEGALQADPQMARLLIFGALHWAVQWWRAPGTGGAARGLRSLDALADEALALFVGRKEE